MKNSSLPAGFNLRPSAWDDLEGVTQLIRANLTAGGDENLAPSAAELGQDWKRSGFNLETDAWVVTDPAGKVIGYEEFDNRFAHAVVRGDGYVHPEYLGLGVGSSLLARLEARARQEIPLAAPDLRVFIRNGVGSKERNASTVHLEAGFKAVRYTWRMEICLDAEPPEADWPSNVELRQFDPARHSQLLYQADEEAFRDHWGHTPDNYETWQTHVIGHPDFDPALCFLTWDGDQLAGFALCRPRQGLGWVGSLGVRRPWRKHGLGMALLKHSFRQFYQRGYNTIGLMVDASSATGATRLYERSGMHIVSEFITYEKELRPGREPEE